MLYISLVRSKLVYGSQLWRPMYIKDIVILERIQRRATRFITNDYVSNYRDRLLSLRMLPLTYTLELLDILFFIKCLKFPDPSFNILDYISFSHSSTRSYTNGKISVRHSRQNGSRHFYFSRIARLWNSLPVIDLSLSLPTIRSQLSKFLRERFLDSFDCNDPCTYHFLCPCAHCHLRSPSTSSFDQLKLN